MKYIACIKKDIRLLTGGGFRWLLFLLFPVMLALFMLLGMNGLASTRAYVEPFPIAVRDEDDTVLSRILIGQLSNVGIFSSIVMAGELSDEELCDIGCAAIISIPRDYFYDLYDMLDSDVRIALNGDMPNEAAMVKSALTSIITIIAENQRVHYAAACVRNGLPDPDDIEQVHSDYSDAAVMDAMGRLSHFNMEALYADEVDNTKLFFLAGICSMIIMFIPLATLKTLPEEADMGMLDRYKAAGGTAFAVFSSKLTVAFTMTALPIAALLIILKPPAIMKILFALIVLFIASYSLFLVISLIFRKSSVAQLAGNLLLLLMLTAGGALYPYELLPLGIQALSRFTLPFYSLQSVYAASRGASYGELIRLLLPVIIAAAALFAISLPLFRNRRRSI